MKSKILSSIFSLIPLFSALVFSSTTFAGGSEGGGSIIEFEGSRPLLLDSITLPTGRALESKEELVSRPENSRPYKEFEPIRSHDLQIMAQAKAKVQAWQTALADSAGKALMNLIEDNLSSMPSARTSHRFNVIPRFYIPDELKDKKFKVETAILYQPQLGAMISSPIWDRVDDQIQVGLLIHESLRQVQNIRGVQLLSDYQLQAITQLISDYSPRNMDFRRFMSPTFLRFCEVRGALLSSQFMVQKAQPYASAAAEITDSMYRLVLEDQKRRSKEFSDGSVTKDQLEAWISDLKAKGIITP